MENGNYIQYGCGLSAPTSWRNFDASPTLRFERIPLLGKLYSKNETRFPHNVEFGDIVKGLPLSENSSEMVYCSHVLEHLSYTDLQAALINTYKILRPGGTFRFVLPDLAHAVENYNTGSSSHKASLFMRETLLGREQRPRGLKGIIKSLLGNSEHMWMWDFEGLKSELENVGFQHVRRAQMGDNPNPKLKDVEDETRWIDCLGIECQKPNP